MISSKIIYECKIYDATGRNYSRIMLNYSNGNQLGIRNSFKFTQKSHPVDNDAS